MLYLLDHVRSSVRTVHVDELSLLVDECLVSLGIELLPEV